MRILAGLLAVLLKMSVEPCPGSMRRKSTQMEAEKEPADVQCVARQQEALGGMRRVSVIGECAQRKLPCDAVAIVVTSCVDKVHTTSRGCAEAFVTLAFGELGEKFVT